MTIKAKEKQMIDEVIFLTFNDREQDTWELMRRGAIKAGYELSDNKIKAQKEAKRMFLTNSDMQEYHDKRWNHFNTLLKDKRTVWEAINSIA